MTNKIKTGIKSLDKLLYGGFERGDSILFIYNSSQYTKGQAVAFSMIKNIIDNYNAHAIIMSLSLPIRSFIKYSKASGFDLEKYKDYGKISLLELYESLHEIYRIRDKRPFEWTHVIDKLDTETYIPKIDSIMRKIAEKNNEKSYIAMLYDISGLSTLYDDSEIIRTLRKYHIVFSHMQEKMLLTLDVVNRAIVGDKLLAWLIHMHDDVIEVYKDEKDGEEYLEIRKCSDPEVYLSLSTDRIKVDELLKEIKNVESI